MASATPPIASVPRFTAFAFSAETAKVVHFVRHGQGFHNVEAAVSVGRAGTSGFIGSAGLRFNNLSLPR